MSAEALRKAKDLAQVALLRSSPDSWEAALHSVNIHMLTDAVYRVEKHEERRKRGEHTTVPADQTAHFNDVMRIARAYLDGPYR